MCAPQGGVVKQRINSGAPSVSVTSALVNVSRPHLKPSYQLGITDQKTTLS